MQTLAAPPRTIHQTLTDIQQATNFHPIIKLVDCPHASILSVHDRETFSLYLEDKSADLRIVVDYHKGHRSLSYRTLTDYNAKTICWETFGRGGYIELSTSAGKKALLARFEELQSETAVWLRTRHMHLYRREGKWGKV